MGHELLGRRGLNLPGSQQPPGRRAEGAEPGSQHPPGRKAEPARQHPPGRKAEGADGKEKRRGG